MSVNMNTVNAYSAYQKTYNNSTIKEKNTATAQRANAAEQPVTNGQKQLSKAAQDLLENLRKSNADIDFMVADFDKGDNAQEILSRGTKEFSVLFSSEELEKMAADEKYLNEKLGDIKGAMRMSEEINAKYGFERGFEKGEVTKIGISFNSDGTTSIFAELEKVSEQQRERIENNREQRAEEKKAAEKKENAGVKKVTVQAASQEELLKKINEIDWSKVKENTQTEGVKFDYFV